ncbi:MAG TPA: hypothetical protein VKB29_11320 [Candidatus Binataceae bacterium]|nr:hypothetical protein [Candidatus Binataceae bacterium]
MLVGDGIIGKVQFKDERHRPDETARRVDRDILDASDVDPPSAFS